MANWGAFSKDFSAAFTPAFRAFSDNAAQQERLALARSADARAQRSSDRAEADAAAYSEYMAAEYGGVADQAAPAPAPTGGSGGRSRAMAIPNKLGAITETGEPVPASPEEAEAAEVAEARTVAGYEPAPPAKVGANRRAIEGDNPQSREAIPAPRAAGRYTGRITPAIARDMEAKRQRAQELEFKNKEFSERQRVNDSTIAANDSTVKYNLTRVTGAEFEQKQKQAQETFAGVASVMTQLPDELNNTAISDPRVQPVVAQVVAGLKATHDLNPDGFTVDVKNTPGGYVVTTIDERTGKPIEGPPQVLKTVGDLKRAGMTIGQMTMGKGFAEYNAAISLDNINMAKLPAEAKAAVQGVRERIANATMEERLEPGWVEKMNAELDALETKYPNEILVEGKENEPNPAYDPSKPSTPDNLPYMTKEDGTPIQRTVKFNPLRDAAALKQPSTDVMTGKGMVPAERLISNMMSNPTQFLKDAGGDPATALMNLRNELVAGKLDPEIADVLVQRVANNLPQALTQALQKVGAPAQVKTLGPQESALMVGPQERQQAWSPGEMSTRERRQALPVVDPRARRVGSPFAR